MTRLSVDFRDLSALEGELDQASLELAEADEVPGWILELLAQLADDLSSLGHDRWEGVVDPYLLIELEQLGIAAALALRIDEPATQCERVEVIVEALREVLSEMQEDAPVGEAVPAGEVVRWLRDVTGTSAHELAPLLGVSKRKLERWLSEGDPSTPTGSDEMRVRVLARVVNQLRYAMTARGVVRWLQRPLTRLDGRAPRDLLDDPQATARLVGLAAEARRSDAS